MKINEITEEIWDAMDPQKAPRQGFIFPYQDEGEDLWCAIDNTKGELLLEVFIKKQDAIDWIEGD